MSDWISEQTGAVSREVASMEWDGGPARVVVATRIYPTPVERIRRWFMPVSGDLRLGGRYQLEGNAGGTIDRCEPPRLLVVTWEFGGNTSWVNVTLEAECEDSTVLRLEHIAPETSFVLGERVPDAHVIRAAGHEGQRTHLVESL